MRKNLVQKLQYQYRNFGKLAFNPFESKAPPSNPDFLKNIVKDIHQWAKNNGARYYSFLAYPHSEGIAQKQETFLQLEYAEDHLFKSLATDDLPHKAILRGEGDGSSFPNGGLRYTNTARGYLIWDWKSNLYIRRSNEVMYVPALLVNHFGEALDEKTLFRKAEEKLNIETKELLKSIGIQAEKIFLGMGLEQEFFIIPKSSYQKRIDLRQTGRCLIGRVPPHHQQFSDHYYGRLERRIQDILMKAEDELVEMGVPIKTRHKEVAPNQFEFCSVFEEAGHAVDHNILTMEVMKEAFDQDGFTCLFHEKPFSNVNGSGKHINWSINYYLDGKRRNLFKPDDFNDDLFLLFTLIKLKAVFNNQKLYLSSVCVPGNELRLGGHEAPPRIMSAFLGDSVTAMVNKLPEKERMNLKEKLHFLVCNIKQEDTDRNRTSPYAFTSNRFEFRAAGSTQNCLFPSVVIFSTMAEEIKKATSEIRKGVSVQDLIKKLVDETCAIRFEGDGYSKDWVKQAKSRNLYINSNFIESIENIKTGGEVLVNSGIYSERELNAKYEITKERYIYTVEKEVNTMLIILNKNIIPRAVEFLKNKELNIGSAFKQKLSKIENLLSQVITESEEMEEQLKDIDLEEAHKIRKKVHRLTHLATEMCENLPECETWPELYDMLNKY